MVVAILLCVIGRLCFVIAAIPRHLLYNIWYTFKGCSSIDLVSPSFWKSVTLKIFCSLWEQSLRCLSNCFSNVAWCAWKRQEVTKVIYPIQKMAEVLQGVPSSLSTFWFVNLCNQNMTASKNEHLQHSTLYKVCSKSLRTDMSNPNHISSVYPPTLFKSIKYNNAYQSLNT